MPSFALNLCCNLVQLAWQEVSCGCVCVSVHVCRERGERKEEIIIT